MPLTETCSFRSTIARACPCSRGRGLRRSHSNSTTSHAAWTTVFRLRRAPVRRVCRIRPTLTSHTRCSRLMSSRGAKLAATSLLNSVTGTARTTSRRRRFSRLSLVHPFRQQRIRTSGEGPSWQTPTSNSSVRAVHPTSFLKVSVYRWATSTNPANSSPIRRGGRSAGPHLRPIQLPSLLD